MTNVEYVMEKWDAANKAGKRPLQKRMTIEECIQGGDWWRARALAHELDTATRDSARNTGTEPTDG